MPSTFPAFFGQGGGAATVYVSDMSAARVLCAALTVAVSLPLACGQRAGDPVVALAETPGPSAGGAAGEAPGSAGDGSAPPPTPSDPGPTGLCGPCETSDECGDANDACIRHDGTRFCGRDCDEQRGCPDGYVCSEVYGSQLFQCVPQSSCPTLSVAPALADARSYLLARINTERLLRGEATLSESDCLDSLAQESALSFARTDEALGKYVDECDPIWPSCACGWNAEAEIAIARYDLDWTSAIAQAVGSYRDSDNVRFVQAFLSANVTDVGIGFWISGDQAWIALSFH